MCSTNFLLRFNKKLQILWLSFSGKICCLFIRIASVLHYINSFLSLLLLCILSQRVCVSFYVCKYEHCLTVKQLLHACVIQRAACGLLLANASLLHSATIQQEIVNWNDFMGLLYSKIRNNLFVKYALPEKSIGKAQQV